MNYSIVIPVHNEEASLESFITAFMRELPHTVPLREVNLVENGSTDGTLAVCNRLRDQFPGMVRVHSVGRASYGEAIKLGIMESRGTHLSILECDCLNVQFVCDSINLFRRHDARFIVASKRHPESVDRRPWKRRLLTFTYNQILRWTIGYPGTDTHGLKSMESICAKRLCRLATTSDEVFQTEIVLLAWRFGIEIHERPIRIEEMRSAPIPILKRTPKILNTVKELKQSLDRFPREGVHIDEVVVDQ